MSRFGKIENDLNWTTKRGPPTLTCYICGRAFGTASISIHIPQCAKKYENEQLTKPKSERRPLPQAPSEVPTGGTYASIDAFNEAAARQYKDTACISCDYCGRNFKDDKTLQIHHRSCTSDRPAKKVGEKLVGGGGALSSLSPARRIAMQVSNSKEEEVEEEEEEEEEEEVVDNEKIAIKRRESLQKWVNQQNTNTQNTTNVDKSSNAVLQKKVTLTKQAKVEEITTNGTWQASLLERFALLNERFEALQSHVVNETALLKDELQALVEEVIAGEEGE
jgi:hypothetical protein